MKTARRRRARARDQAGTKPGPRKNNPGVVLRVGQDKGKTASYEGAALRAIVADPGAPATAKVTALRTLAEINGHIGRHQPAPDRSAEASLSGLSREDLIGELERLRGAVDLGLLR